MIPAYWFSVANQLKMKKKIGRFFGVLLGTLGACLFENILEGKDVDAIRADHEVVWAGNGIIRAEEGF